MIWVSNRAFRSAVAIAAACLIQAGPAAAQEQPQKYELLLFGANWCVPCRAELAEVAELSSALGPGQIVLAWLGRPPNLKAPGLPANVRLISGDPAQALFETFPSFGGGIPIALMRDDRSTVCAVIKRRISMVRPSSAMTRPVDE